MCSNLEVAHNRLKQYANAKRRHEEFEVGEWFYLKLQPYRQSSVFKRINQKLASKFFGPFKITEHNGSIVYRLNLPGESKMHTVFHISLLRRKIGEDIDVRTNLPPYSQEGLPALEPEQVLEYR